MARYGKKRSLADDLSDLADGDSSRIAASDLLGGTSRYARLPHAFLELDARSP